MEPFRTSDETIRLTPSEVATFNRIAFDSFQASGRPVSADQTYSMTDVSEVFFPSFALYYEYQTWGTVAKNWSEFLHNNRDGPAPQVMKRFAAEQVYHLPSTPMFLDALVGMIALDQIEIHYSPADCKADPSSSGIRLKDEGDSLVIDWGSFSSEVTSKDNEISRVDAGRTVGYLLSHGCIDIVIDVFSKMEEIFVREAKHMQSFLDEWEAVLRKRKSKTIEISLTISNVGKFDTHIRRDVRAAIGAKGDSEKIHFTVQAKPETEKGGGDGLYRHLGTRSASTIVFRTSLDADESERVHGAFTSGLNYIRVAVLASSGDWKEVVFSSVAPFSSAAKSQSERQINDILIAF